MYIFVHCNIPLFVHSYSIINIHQITKKIVGNNDIIVTETLQIKNMIKNHHLSKVVTDASLSEIIRQLEYKSKWKNKKIYILSK